VTPRTAPVDRYGGDIELIRAVSCRTTGFAREGLDRRGYCAARDALLDAAGDGPVHFTGVHLWNLPLARGLMRRGIPVIHTLHDLAPHSDARRRWLIRLWNRWLIASGVTLLVHAECYGRELAGRGVPETRVRVAPLTHGFLGPAADAQAEQRIAAMRAAGGSRSVVLFFGRVEQYKGAHTLIEAWRIALALGLRRGELIVAGRVAPGVALPPLPERAELRDRRIEDDEGLELFGRAALLVLPYRDATQSALIAAGARFGVPSVVTDTGALPEYVSHGETGWIVPREDPAALAETLIDALSDPARLTRIGEAACGRRLAMRERELSALASLYGNAALTTHSSIDRVTVAAGGAPRG
jgi:glycosyltransferase involved in cell wall biosynthesis